MDQIKTFEKYAIFQNGGKQYQAVEGKTIELEKIEGEPGQKVTFDEVLLVRSSDNDIVVGQPFTKTKITASIVKHGKAAKVTSFRFKRRKKVQVKKGHRQEFTVVRVEKI